MQYERPMVVSNQNLLILRVKNWGSFGGICSPVLRSDEKVYSIR
jgi:hypothetical protein